jgi:two-component system response regulator HydG
MIKRTILIVDDSYDILEVLQRQLSALNYTTFQASAVADAIDILENSKIDLLITDLQMPVKNGMELVKYSAKNFPAIPILVITGFPSVSGAVEAVKSGALDYLVKPFTAEELKKAVQKTIKQHYGTEDKLEDRVDEKGDVSDFWGIIGQSKEVHELIDLIKKINSNKVTTLISGESGTGKELVARAIHYSGSHSKSPFIAVNCGAIPENLLESELFGFTKGAFTGAYDTRLGFFQAAHGGTIFLDEIGNASASVQTRLLRVIQEKEVTMIGANKPQPIDVRIIAATNSDLYAMSRNDKFREDLYYRLNVISVSIPPLRERKNDIILLANFFLDKFSAEFGKTGISLSKKVLHQLTSHSWPGNIRELENVIQSALILCDNIIEPQHLPAYLRTSSHLNVNKNENLLSLKEIEFQHILKVLKSVNNNKTQAAEILGINRKTLRQKLQENNGS